MLTWCSTWCFRLTQCWFAWKCSYLAWEQVVYAYMGALQTHHIVKLTSPTLLTPISGVVLQWRNRLARRTYKQYLPSKRCGGCEFEPHLEHVFSWRNIKMYTHAGYVRQYSDQLTWGIEPTPSIHVYLSEMYVHPATIEPTPTWFVSLMWMLHVHCNIIHTWAYIVVVLQLK